MHSIAEIEAAIEQLPANEVEEIRRWLESRPQPAAKESLIPVYERWLEKTRGLGIPGIRTEDILALTRGEE